MQPRVELVWAEDKQWVALLVDNVLQRAWYNFNPDTWPRTIAVYSEWAHILARHIGGVAIEREAPGTWIEQKKAAQAALHGAQQQTIATTT